MRIPSIRPPHRHLALALLLLVAAARPLAAQQPAVISAPPSSPPYGVIVMAHGGNAEWNRQVADAVAASATDVPLQVAFGMADRASLAASVAALEAEGVRRIVVVRLFVSGESFLAQTRYLLGLDDVPPAMLFDSTRTSGMRPVDDPASVPPIAHDSAIAISPHGLVDAELSGRILAARALGLSTHPESETVLVIAHGLGDEDGNDRLLRALHERAAAIDDAAPFRAVEVVTLREDWPEQRALAERRIRDIVARGAADGRVIVVPFRVAGFGPYAEVLDGLDYAADGLGLLPHPGLSDWILRTAHTTACAAAWAETRCATR